MKNCCQIKQILAGICFLFLFLGNIQSLLAEQQGKAPVPEVEVVSVTERTIQSALELPGRISAYRIAEVRPQIGGIVEKRCFAEGSNVKAKEVLYQIDPTLYRAQLDSAGANLAQAEAVEYAARLKADRYKELLATNAISDQEYTEVDAAWKKATASVAACKAAVKAAVINLNYTQIKAPIAGRVGKSLISEGALVTASQPTPLATIQQLDPLYIDISQSADELLRLKKRMGANGGAGQKSVQPSKVEVLLADGSKYQHTGILKFSDVTVEPSTGSVILRAVVPNPDLSLLPGMFVRTRLIHSEKIRAMIIPQAAISRDKKGQVTVLVVNSRSVAEPRILTVGREQSDKTIAVLSGLALGEQVIVAGLQTIRAGMPVKAVPAVTFKPAPNSVQ